MPKYRIEVTAHGYFDITADSAEEAALDVYNNYSRGDILDAVGDNWISAADESDEFPREVS